MTALKPYPAYKASGAEWLGEVPSHWEVRQLGRVGRFSKGSGGTKKDQSEHGIPCIRYGDLYTQHQFFITESRTFVTRRLAATYTPVRYGDVLFAGSGEPRLFMGHVDKGFQPGVFVRSQPGFS